MTLVPAHRLRLAAGATALLFVGAAAGGAIVRFRPLGETPPAAAAPERRVLYWYDPMMPDQHFDAPGKSPFMDMPLVPRYADEAAAEGPAGVRIDPALTQSLGARYVPVRRGFLAGDLAVPAVVDFNQRDLAVVQARAGGFVQRVYGRAPGDVIAAGAPLADLLVPEWGGAQAEYLAVRAAGDERLAQAARQRLLLLGMPESLVTAVDRNGRPRTTVTVTSPTGGVIRTLGVRAGMTVASGQTLAEVNGLSTVWLNAAVPEAEAARLRVGQGVEIGFAGFPGERFSGRLGALLPEVSGDSRTLTARIELSSQGGRLRPGMYGQVVFGGGTEETLLVPSEAVIRTGTRTLVMLAAPEGRFQAAEVRVGREASGQTQILQGLAEGEQVVASGQFLIDSEASLAGVDVRSLPDPRRGAPAPEAARPARKSTVRPGAPPSTPSPAPPAPATPAAPADHAGHDGAH